MNRFGTMLMALGGATLLAGSAAAVEVRTVLKPEEVDLGEAAQLHVQISGTMRTSKPEFPRVDGLVITYVAYTTNVRMENGRTSAGVNLIYHVQPHRTGVFNIPSVEFTAGGGEPVRTEPVTLRVGKTAGGYQPSPQGQQQQAPFAGTAPQPIPSSTDAPPELSSQLATIQLIYPKRDFYVGELVPAQLRLYLHRGLAVREVTLPQVSGSAFTVGKLGGDPDDKRLEMINGRPFAVYTWNTALAAIRPGEHPLGAKIEAKVLVEEEGARRSGPFADSFFDQFFRNHQYEEKRVTLKTPETTVKVMPLPETGRPEDFTGAIGKFDVTAEASPRDVTAGDPITLKVAVSGTGNFDRVKLPEIKKDFGFKTYAPSSSFEPEDASGSTGKKVFEQMIVPQRGEIRQIPPITFSYFDPDDKKYVTVATSEIPIRVRGAAVAAAPKVTAVAQPPPAASHTQPQPGAAGFVASDSNLVPNKLEQGWTTGSLAPVVYEPWFWAMQVAPLSALTVAFFIARRRDRFSTDPAYARAVSASRAIQTHLAALDAAALRRDTPAFFQAARRVLQERLGEKLGCRADTITLADLSGIEGRLGPGANGSVWPEIRAIFDVADAVAYSGQSYSAESLQEWKARVMGALKGMEKL